MGKRKTPLGFELLHSLPGHDGDSAITAVAWSSDGSVLASAGDDGTVLLWDAHTGERIRALDDQEQVVYCLSWSSKGELASGCGHQVRVWDSGSGRCRRTFRCPRGEVLALAWSPDGLSLASGTDSGKVQLWPSSPGTKGKTFESCSAIYGLAWSPEGKGLAAACYDEEIPLWDVQTGRIRRRLPGIKGTSTFSIAWSAKGKRIAAGFYDGTIRLWDTRQDKNFLRDQLDGHDDQVGSLSFSFDGRLLASKSQDNTVRLWDCETQQVLSVLRETASEEWVGGIGFHPRELVLATFDREDTLIRIWRVNPGAVIKLEEKKLDEKKTHRPAPEATKRVKVFVSYSQKDAEWLVQLKVFLKPLERAGIVDAWDDTRTPPGGAWRDQIEEALGSANVAVLLVSAEFLASDFINDAELPRFLEAERARGLTVIPVILKPCRFKKSRIAQFQAINPGLKSMLEMNEVERCQLLSSLADAIESHLPSDGVMRPA